MASQTDLGKWMITNGGEYSPDATYEQLTMVLYKNSTYITLRTVSGVSPQDDRINYILMAQGFSATALSDVTATDTQGVIGNPGETVSSQSLVDYLTDAVINKLIKKIDITNIQVNDKNKVPSAALVYAQQQELDQLNSNLAGQEYVLLDLDTLTDSSQNGYTKSCTNVPPGTGNGYLEIVSNKRGLALQRYTPYSSNTTYIRQMLADGTWGSWKKQFEELWVTERANTGTAGNLNNIVQPGLHKKLINPSSSNSPGFYCYLIVLSYGNGGNITQVAFGYNQTSIAIRYRFDNTWSAWSVK